MKFFVDVFKSIINTPRRCVYKIYTLAKISFDFGGWIPLISPYISPYLRRADDFTAPPSYLPWGVASTPLFALAHTLRVMSEHTCIFTHYLNLEKSLKNLLQSGLIWSRKTPIAPRSTFSGLSPFLGSLHTRPK